MPQLSMLDVGLDPETAAAVRDGAIEVGDHNADEEWATAALAAIRATAEELDEFTSDDVLARLGPRPNDNPVDLRALGGRFKRAKADGICAPTDRVRPCGRVSRHGAPIRVWRSLLRTQTPTPDGPVLSVVK